MEAINLKRKIFVLFFAVADVIHPSIRLLETTENMKCYDIAKNGHRRGVNLKRCDLYKVIEGWNQKEMERQEVVNRLQQENFRRMVSHASSTAQTFCDSGKPSFRNKGQRLGLHPVLPNPLRTKPKTNPNRFLANWDQAKREDTLKGS